MSDPTRDKGLELVKKGRELLSLAPPFKDEARGRDYFSQKLKDLRLRLDGLDGRICLGIMGGTGVGKSTLISALAHNPISMASAIRPTTNVPVLYRHEDFRNNIKGQALEEAVHRLEGLRRVAIVDFPDFDSLVPSHPQAALALMAEMDMIIWVADPYKYADRKLYEIMSRARHLAGTSQVAVLNKVDEIPSQAQTDELLQSFQHLLREKAGWTGLPPWPVSAFKALMGQSGGGLEPIRALLKELREEKFRRTAQRENLNARCADLKKELNEALAPSSWLEDIEKLKVLASEFKAGKILGPEMKALAFPLEAETESDLKLFKRKASGLLGLLTDFWEFFFRRSGRLSGDGPPLACPAFARYLAGQLENLEPFVPGSIKTPESLTEETEDLISGAFARQRPVKGPQSLALYLWPLFWAALLLWAGALGRLDASTLTAAAIKSIVPFIVGGVLGDLFISRFIWRRLKKRLYLKNLAALSAAREDLETMTDSLFQKPLEKRMSLDVAWLDALADFNNVGNDLA